MLKLNHIVIAIAVNSSYDVVKEFLEELLPCVSDDLQTLVDGGSVSKNIHVFIDHEWLENYNSSDFWDFLVYSGYLTLAQNSMYVDFEPVELVIPNNKVKEYFKKSLKIR